MMNKWFQLTNKLRFPLLFTNKKRKYLRPYAYGVYDTCVFCVLSEHTFLYAQTLDNQAITRYPQKHYAHHARVSRA